MDLAGTASSPQGSASAIKSVAYSVDGTAGSRAVEFDGSKWSIKALPLINNKAVLVKVTAADAAGNQGEAALSILMDTTAPAAPVFDAQPPTVVTKADGRTSLQWSWNRTGEAADSFVVKLNGSEVARQTGTSYSIRDFEDGTYLLQVTEKDPTGNTSGDAKAISVLVDRVPPSQPLLTGNTKPTPNPVWNWVPQVNSGGNGSFRYRLQAGNFSLESKTGTFALPATGYPDNQYTLGVQEKDNANNWSEEAKFTITLDRTPPVIKILTPVDGYVTNRPSVTLTYSIQEGSVKSSSQKTVALPLDNGLENVVTVTSDADEAGNIGTATLKAYRYSNVLFVRKGSRPRGDGTSWDDAFDDLQIALDTNKTLPAGTQIWISAGTYATGAVSGASFLLQPNIGLYGGFASTGYPRGLDSRSAANPTILRGNPIDGGYILDGNVQFRSKVENVVIDGFSVTGGRFGIMMGQSNSNFRITKCIFSGFGTDGIQGTIPLYLNGDGVFSECRISGNQNLEEAAAQVVGGRFVFDRCEFKDNQGGSFAGGLKIGDGVHSLRSCIISGNTAMNSEPGFAQEVIVASGILDISDTKIEGGKSGIETWPWSGAELIWGTGNTEP